jgi:uncharacterized protein (TIGR03437 family)
MRMLSEVKQLVRCLAMFLAVALTAAAQPRITAVFNAFGGASQTRLSPGCFFTVQGAGLGAPNPTIQVSTAPNYPTSFLGTSISFTPAAGGAPAAAKIWFPSPAQVNGILPSAIAPGSYNATVTYNSQTSANFPVTIVARSFGIATADSSGAGPAQATDANVNGGLSLVRFTTSSIPYLGNSWTLSPAHSGDVLIFWGSGGGADLANDTGGSSGDQTAAANAQVLIDGVAVKPDYFGSSPGFPGLWQTNVKLPGNILPGCSHNVQILAGGELSNAVTIAVAAAGQSACPSPAFTTAQLARLDAGGTLTTGYFSFLKGTTTLSLSLGGIPVNQTTNTESIGGLFNQLTAADIGSQAVAVNQGECAVYTTTSTIDRLVAGAAINALDAGATLQATGPGLGTNSALTRASDKSYNLSLRTGTITSGRYTLAGAGGPDVGAFSGSTDIPGQFSPSNFASINTIARANPLNVTWSGGGSGDVAISAFAATTVSGSITDTSTWLLRATVFLCIAPASRGSFTVPGSVLSQLPAAGNDPTSGSFGLFSVTAVSDGQQGRFTAPLAKGGSIDFGLVDYSINFSKNVSIQ